MNLEERTALLTGATGQLGAELVGHLGSVGTLYAPSHADLDLTDAVALQRYMIDLRPELLVNAAAYNAVDEAERDSRAHGGSDPS